MPSDETKTLARGVADALEADAGIAAGQAFSALVAEYLARTRDPEGLRSVPLPAEELATLFREPLPQGIRSLSEVLERLRVEVVPNANWLAHPRYVGHQVSAPLPAAVWSEALVSVLNNSLAVEEMSPAATAIERQVIRWMAGLAGLGPAAGGTLVSGGTEATFAALLAARAAVAPDAWEDGFSARDLVVVTGEHTHYAVTRAIGALGVGTRNAVVVPSVDHRMDPEALAAALDGIARGGRRVMAVVATAGSTATGSFDDLETIGRICDERKLWLHVDGAHGASALLSSRHRGRLRGIERAQSVAWDPHKMMLLPLATGVLLVRDERLLDRAFAQQAPYLFHGAAGAPVRDQGVRSFQCSRRADALKLWVALQRYGADGIGALYDRLCDVAEGMHVEIGRRPEFEAVHAPESNILCFRWVGVPRRPEAELDGLNLALRERFNQSGLGWITTTVLGGRRVLRVTVMNPRTTPADAAAVLDGLAATAAELPVVVASGGAAP
jgi:L-2,4-diaminobutyrate decarboxylase